MQVEHEKLIYNSEQKLVEFALKHGLPLYLGDSDYGSGRSLVHEDGEYKNRGDWLYSSEQC